jgi:CDP-glycerol glycerophosphotransferase
MYDFVKVCPPARKLVRNMLFRYRGWVYRRAVRGVVTDPNLMVFCVFSGRGYSDSPRALYEYMVNREEYQNYRYVWVFQQPQRFYSLAEETGFY